MADLIITSTKYQFSYPFSLGEFTDGFTNSFEAVLVDKKTNPGRQIWKRGSMKPISLTLELAVMNEGPIQTPDKLVRVMEDFMNMALPPAEVTGVPDKVTLSIGSWFRRRAYIQDVTVMAKRPYDIITGKPFFADITIELLPIFNQNPVQGFNFTKT